MGGMYLKAMQSLYETAQTAESVNDVLSTFEMKMALKWRCLLSLWLLRLLIYGWSDDSDDS